MTWVGALVRNRFRQWWQSRLPLGDLITLTQRRVYILPTAAGFMLAATLLVLLVASINYQLNLGYLMTFLLAGSAVAGMHIGHGTLRGLTMSLTAPEPQFMGVNAVFDVRLINDRRSPRHGIGLAVVDATHADHWSWTDVPAQGMATVQVAFRPDRRGLHRLPALTAQTLFPLGTFRVWTVWRPAAQVLVYPTPEAHAPGLPQGEPRPGGANIGSRQDTGEFEGLRAYQRGDPLKLIAWKQVARAAARGSDELMSRDAQQAQRYALWLDFAHTGLQGTEQRLSRLCAWVLQAERQDRDYGLRLPGLAINPGRGEAHKRRCLEALATC